MQKKVSHVELGRAGENFARTFLEKKGYRIIKSNYRVPVGELDFICEDGPTLVFVEVKTRASDVAGGPEEAVHWKKQKQLYRVAQWYLNEIHYRSERPVRFDVVSVSPEAGNPAFSAELFRNAFSL